MRGVITSFASASGSLVRLGLEEVRIDDSTLQNLLDMCWSALKEPDIREAEKIIEYKMDEASHIRQPFHFQPHCILEPRRPSRLNPKLGSRLHSNDPFHVLLS